MKRVGPELKMPDLKNVKVPPFFTDLFYDLRDRRLLPLVALVLIAIVATPFLLGGTDEVEPVPPAGGSVEATQTSSLRVVEAHPGLRDYRRRFERRTPNDPFRQRFTAPSGQGGLPEESSSATTSVEAGSGDGEAVPGGTTASSEPAATPESSHPSDDGGTDGGDVPDSSLRLFTFAVDVKISSVRTNANGKREKNEPEVREEVVPPAPLPSAKTQVVTYMGISPKTQNPLLLVSDDVEAIFGEGKCISGSESCQLLEVELGLPTTFVYEPTGARFKINVLKVEPVFKGRYED